MLIAELERALLRDENIAGSELVLEELRRTIRAAAQPVPRIGDAARLFFMPLEPFLVEGSADHNRVGHMARLSLEPIWGWIGRDLMPAEAKALSEDIDRALLAEDAQGRTIGPRAARACDPAHEGCPCHRRHRREGAPAVRRSGRYAASHRGCHDPDAYPRNSRRACRTGEAAARLFARLRARADRAGQDAIDTAAQRSRSAATRHAKPTSSASVS